MIQVIIGSKGSGKTKRLIDMTNAAIQNESGMIVFIDKDNGYMYDLRHEIRFVNASEYAVVKGCQASEFLSFLCGMLSVNYDISLIAIDAFKKLIKNDLDSDEMKSFFQQLEKLSEEHKCNFIISMSSASEEVPEYIRNYQV